MKSIGDDGDVMAVVLDYERGVVGGVELHVFERFFFIFSNHVKLQLGGSDLFPHS